MNLSYLKYAAEVEKTGSITKAAQNFYMNQPHLSKIIRELERNLGSPIFDRTSRGMVPTKRGEEFLRYAKAIMAQEEQIEALCQTAAQRPLSIRLAVPRATYISCVFSSYMKELADCPAMKINYLETNSKDTIRGVSSRSFDLGVIRCQSLYAPYYQKMLQDENLESQEIWEFSCNLLMSGDHPLAGKEQLTYLDLTDYIELVQGDIQTPSFTFETEEAPSMVGKSRKTISIYDRGSQFELLRQLPQSYMWISPMPGRTAAALNLVQRPCSCPGNRYKDILIRRSGYRMSKEEQGLADGLFQLAKQLTHGVN